jgi:hypothetical protein
MLAPDSLGSVDKRTWDGYKASAQSVAAQITVDPAALARVVSCTPEGDGTTCAQQFIQEFGARVFRRPLTVDEVNRFEALWNARALTTPNGTFDDGIHLLVEAFLLSPSFLMRAETNEVREGDYFALSSYEVASRLSYMLWGSMPDESLFAAAAAGALSTPEQIRAQAQRMLADPKARTNVAAFHRAYMHMGSGTRWEDIVRDAAKYPAFTEAQVPLLAAETERFFDHVVFDLGGTFQDLLTRPVGFVNADLAPLYGLNPAGLGAELVRVDLDPATRPGVLTRAGFLAAYSLYNRPSPILRGAFVQKEILCANIPPPPDEAESTALPADPSLITNRQRVQAQTSASECAACHHNLINPSGFPLELFDAVGSVQATDNGAPIDTTSTVSLGASTADVTGPADYMLALAGSPEAQRCYAEKWVAKAYERAPNSQDACLVNMMAARLSEGGYPVVELVADLTQVDSFRLRAMEVAQ